MAKTLISQSNIRTIVVREATALTTSYTTSDSINIQGANQLQLLVSFSKGSSDGCRIKIEFSENEQDWYQESMVNFLQNCAQHEALVREISNSSDLVISIPISASFLRVSGKAVASGTSTSLSILATIANI